MYQEISYMTLYKIKTYLVDECFLNFCVYYFYVGSYIDSHDEILILKFLTKCAPIYMILNLDEKF